MSMGGMEEIKGGSKDRVPQGIGAGKEGSMILNLEES